MLQLSDRFLSPSLSRALLDRFIRVKRFPDLIPLWDTIRFFPEPLRAAFGERLVRTHLFDQMRTQWDYQVISAILSDEAKCRDIKQVLINITPI